MKRCPQCDQTFADDRILCVQDGTELVPLKERPGTRDLLLGVVLDQKYRLERQIGRGGMGTVYMANHTKFNKQVAIKVLSQEMMDDPIAYERLKREAEAAARIKHPNVVTAMDFNQTAEGIVYLVMEYVDGISLRRILEKERKLPVDRVINLAMQICAAIATAHRAAVIHRDLKPDNVMVEMIDNREVAKVLDFGIAKIKDTQQSRITRTDSVLGTPLYMSPEQCNGGTIDHRSDIYALGVMLYEMLAGCPPFQANSAPAIIVQHVTKDPTPLIAIAPDVPPAIAHVIMRALEKHADRRQQSATELATQLEAAWELFEATKEQQTATVTTNTADQWQVLFLGPLDQSDAGREKVQRGLQQKFGLTPEKVTELLDGKVRSVKKTNSLKDAERIVGRLRAIGAAVKLETLVTPPALVPNPAATDAATDYEAVVNTPTVINEANALAKSEIELSVESPNAENSPTATDVGAPRATLVKAVAEKAKEVTEKDPLVMTANAEMLSYLTSHQGTPNTEAQPETISQAAQTNEISSINLSPNANEQGWAVDVNGFIYEKMSEQDVEAWIRAGRLRATHLARRGQGQWQEIGRIPLLRRILEQVNPGSLHSPSAVQEKEERLPQSTFVYSMVKLVAVILVAYILVNLGMQYTQRRLLDDEIQLVLNDRRTTVRSLRGRITSAITNRGLQVPKEQVKVTADVAQHTVTVRVDYQRTLLAIPLHYQVKREHTFNLPLPELAALPEGEIDIGGIAPGELERLRREGINKQITEKMGNYVGEADTLTEKQALEAERAEFERNLALFEVTSVDEAGREIRPQTIKIRGQDYSQEEARRHLDDLNTKIGDLQHLLQQQREKKRATLTEELQPSLPSR